MDAATVRALKTEMDFIEVGIRSHDPVHCKCDDCLRFLAIADDLIHSGALFTDEELLGDLCEGVTDERIHC